MTRCRSNTIFTVPTSKKTSSKGPWTCPWKSIVGSWKCSADLPNWKLRFSTINPKRSENASLELKVRWELKVAGKADEMQWSLKPGPMESDIRQLAGQINMDPVLAQLLLQRGIGDSESARTFFRPELSQLHDPFLMRDMDRAVERIERALGQQERILVYGDYDVDGTTSVALVSSFLKETHPSLVDTYIPDRYLEGYGLSFQGVEYALDNDISLVIALDCGIKALVQIAYAKEKGVDVIVCDHHIPGGELPPAVAILDPKREDCDYPYKELCGCGVGFKLIQALAGKRGGKVEELLPYLDLVATAI